MQNQLFECKSWFYYDKPKLYDGQELQLKREPDNQYDANAVEIYTKDGLKVGHIPANMAESVSKSLEDKELLFVTVVSPYDEELETPPWLQIQDLYTRLEVEAHARKSEETASKVNTAVMIVVPILILLSLGGCVALML